MTAYERGVLLSLRTICFMLVRLMYVALNCRPSVCSGSSDIAKNHISLANEALDELPTVEELVNS